ncbi:prolyl-tRNA synthetase [Cichlidogyrus casuarinus]|uniref:proline--tRNA ligase n=1 Tax=Cichlidogyrus casuarinus TaxID=1844966 RepID=A0ABD2Q063_9PLAT
MVHSIFQSLQLVNQTDNGLITICPLLQRSLDKLVDIVEAHMITLEAQKLTIPILCGSDKFNKSERSKSMEKELLSTKDRAGHTYYLQPTCEEEITSLVSQFKPSKSILPLLLYQINAKFRDEPRPKHGLLRCREFLMKDLYSFSYDLDLARKTYEEVCSVYERIFSQLDIPYVKARATVGSIGGILSHEFHILSPFGEDKISICSSCNNAYNVECLESQTSSPSKCQECSSSLETHSAIEIGHCFLLGDKYSAIFKATPFNDPKTLLQMGCYGIGISRLLAAISLSKTDFSKEKINLRWPAALSPFSAAFLLPKTNSIDSPSVETLARVQTTISELYPHFKRSRDLLLDDRGPLTLGRKLVDIDKLGIRFAIILKEPQESQNFQVMDLYSGQQFFAPLTEMSHFLCPYPETMPHFNK